MVDYLSDWHVALNNGNKTAITDVEVTKYMDKVSNATFKTIEEFAIDMTKENYAKIFYKNIRVFDGYMRERSYDKDGRASCRLDEISYVLWDSKCQSDSVIGLFQPEVRIDGREPWSGDKRTIGYYIDKIVNDFNKSGISIEFVDTSENQELSSRTSIIGQTESSGLPSLVLTHMSIFMALKRVIMDWCGYNMWFDIRLNADGSLGGKLYAGRTREQITGASIPLFTSSKKTESQTQVPATMVYVRCTNGSQIITGSAGTDPARSVTYQIDGAFSEAELNAIAARVMEERAQGSVSYEVNWGDVSTVYIDPEPADSFNKIGDLTLEKDKPEMIMPWKEYIIREISLSSSDGTTCVIGDDKKSIFDIYQSTLSLVDGANSISTDTDVYADYGVIEVEGSTATDKFKGWKEIIDAKSSGGTSDTNTPASCGNGGGMFLIDDELKLPASTDDIIYVKVNIGSPRCDDPSVSKYGDAYTDPYNPEYYTAGKVSNRSVTVNLYKGDDSST